MELGVIDRLVVLRVLPEEGNLVTLRIVRDLKSELSFTEEEHAAIGFVYDGGMLKGLTNDIKKDVEIGPKAMEIIVDKLTGLEKTNKLPLDFLGVYEKFVTSDS